MSPPVYGLIFDETTTAPYPIVVGDSSIIGLVLCQDDAAPSSFPLGVATAFNSSDPNYITAATSGGAPNIGATGDLALAVASINNQLSQFEVGAQIVVVPVARVSNLGSPDANLAATIANIVAGLPGLLQAGPRLGLIPRLIGCPGYTGRNALSVASANIVGGSGITTETVVTFSPAGATAVVEVNDGVASINMTNAGSYAPGTVVTAALSGVGTGAVAVTLASLANPVLAALPAILTSLSGTAYVSDSGDGVQVNSIAWRQLLASDCLNPSDAYVIPGSGSGYTDGVAEALGLQVAVDFQHKGLPGWSISGQQVLGIAGLKNYYPFSLTDGSTQGQQLLSNQISTIEAGVIGSDTAAASSGFVWQGVWNASTNPNAWFINKRRMKDWCYLQLIKSMRAHLGVENTTPQSVQDVLNDMAALGSYLLSQQISIGFAVTFVASQTSPSNLQQGQFTVGFANETPAPITLITVLSSDYYQALVVEEQTIVSEAAGVTPQYISAASSSASGD